MRKEYSTPDLLSWRVNSSVSTQRAASVLDLRGGACADSRTVGHSSVGFTLNGSHLGLAKPHATHSKMERGGPESELKSPSNSFIFNNMTERVGFDFRHLAQVVQKRKDRNALSKRE